jgi:hypothetical protein
MMDPAGQYVPGSQVVRLDGTGQNDPAGQMDVALEPKGQYCVDKHAVMLIDLTGQKNPGGQMICTVELGQ